MGYQQIKLFVKPSSTFPYEKINDYFISYLNNRQKDQLDYVIGDLYNARENEMWAIFSDRTREGHNMTVSALPIYRSSTEQEKLNVLSDEISKNVQEVSLKCDDLSQKNLEVHAHELESFEHEKNMLIEQIKTEISSQQIFNEITSQIFNELVLKTDQMQATIEIKVANYLIQKSLEK